MAAYTDLIYCLGFVFLFMAFLTAVGAFSRGAPPRAAMLSLFAGGCMIVYANASKPGGYSVEQLPDLVMKILAS